MEESAENQTTDKAGAVPDTPLAQDDLGGRLRQCRASADLTQEQAASEMRLPLHVLKALESEKLAELPEPPYVRGYLRSYARLADTDPAPLITAYERLRGGNPDDISYSPATPLNRVAAKQPMSPSTVKLIALSGLVLFLGLLSMIPGITEWASDTWENFSRPTTESQPLNAPVEAGVGQIQRPGQAASTEQASSRNDTPAPAPDQSAHQLALATPPLGSDTPDEQPDNPQTATPAGIQDTAEDPSDAAADPDSGADSAPPPEDEGDEAMGAGVTGVSGNSTLQTTTAGPEGGETGTAAAADNPANTAVAPAADTSTTAAVSTGSTQTADGSSADTSNPPGTATGAGTTAAVAPTQASPTQPSVAVTNDFQQPIDGEVSVRLEFSQEVWMQVKDGNGKRLFEALNSPNTWKAFKARTPLVFKIGNAAGVRVLLNGQVYNHQSHTRGNVSNFRID
ncbi:MAG: DUF4115 domain-containing protein [Thiothrix sp.]|nr:DUF4115 domain-containing protein [Thiothrix sp.]